MTCVWPSALRLSAAILMGSSPQDVLIEISSSRFSRSSERLLTSQSQVIKNREWGKDFWNGLVGPQLGADTDVETWIRGPIPPVADTDGIHKTFDIKFINLGPLGAHWAWPETQDHAKWGITKDSDWICVGDINRMISQRERGGGIIAFQNRTLWQALSKTDLILAPPGHTRDEALQLIKSTHVDPNAPTRAPVAKPKPAAKAKRPKAR